MLLQSSISENIYLHFTPPCTTMNLLQWGVSIVHSWAYSLAREWKLTGRRRCASEQYKVYCTRSIWWTYITHSLTTLPFFYEVRVVQSIIYNCSLFPLFIKSVCWITNIFNKLLCDAIWDIITTGIHNSHVRRMVLLVKYGLVGSIQLAL